VSIGGGKCFRTPCGANVSLDSDFRMLEIAPYGRGDDMVDIVVQAFRISAPPQPGFAVVDSSTQLFLAAPRRCWLRSDGVSKPLPEVAGLAITEISDALVCLRISGESVRDWLGRYSPLDIRPRVFGQDRVAWTQFLGVRVLLHCVSSDVFNIYTGSSFVKDIVDWPILLSRST
jgi:sarcosine oxidase gamma subunit